MPLAFNNGVDGRGVNIKNSTNQYVVKLSNDVSFEFKDDQIVEDLDVFEALKEYFKRHKPSIFDRLLLKIRNFLL